MPTSMLTLVAGRHSRPMELVLAEHVAFFQNPASPLFDADRREAILRSNKRYYGIQRETGTSGTAPPVHFNAARWDPAGFEGQARAGALKALRWTWLLQTRWLLRKRRRCRLLKQVYRLPLRPN